MWIFFSSYLFGQRGHHPCTVRPCTFYYILHCKCGFFFIPRYLASEVIITVLLDPSPITTFFRPNVDFFFFLSIWPERSSSLYGQTLHLLLHSTLQMWIF